MADSKSFYTLIPLPGQTLPWVDTRSYFSISYYNFFLTSFQSFSTFALCGTSPFVGSGTMIASRLRWRNGSTKAFDRPIPLFDSFPADHPALGCRTSAPDLTCIGTLARKQSRLVQSAPSPPLAPPPHSISDGTLAYLSA
jgi:hypothetical protein